MLVLYINTLLAPLQCRPSISVAEHSANVLAIHERIPAVRSQSISPVMLTLLGGSAIATRQGQMKGHLQVGDDLVPRKVTYPQLSLSVFPKSSCLSNEGRLTEALT